MLVAVPSVRVHRVSARPQSQVPRRAQLDHIAASVLFELPCIACIGGGGGGPQTQFGTHQCERLLQKCDSLSTQLIGAARDRSKSCCCGGFSSSANDGPRFTPAEATGAPTATAPTSGAASIRAASRARAAGAPRRRRGAGRVPPHFRAVSYGGGADPAVTRRLAVRWPVCWLTVWSACRVGDGLAPARDPTKLRSPTA